MSRVILLRHGESEWNLANRFTGWTDVDLSDTGRRQAWAAGEALARAELLPTVTFTSVLTRAIRTLWLALDASDRMWLPVTRDWRLNERHYGALQGENKKEFEARYGAEQVHAWRRSYATRPPELDGTDPRHPRFDPRYAGLDPAGLPAAESLADTIERVRPWWDEALRPCIEAGQDALVAAHGNSLRALIKDLEGYSDEGIAGLDVPLAEPLIYEFDARGELVDKTTLTLSEE
ncbi:MAG: 2,3-diphosphoglycerate-dependent phosphoglycerate mutase [Pseudomonadota bacterium]